MIARPLRRPGPIPFAPFPPLADRPIERTIERPLMAGARETRDIRETRLRSRWLPTAPAMPTAHRAEASGRAQVVAQAKPSGGGNLGTLQGTTQASTSRTPRGGCHAIYHGQGTLSVLSSITGHHYRFEGRGCTLMIDPRDRLVLGRLNELTIHNTVA